MYLLWTQVVQDTESPRPGLYSSEGNNSADGTFIVEFNIDEGIREADAAMYDPRNDLSNGDAGSFNLDTGDSGEENVD